MNQADRAEYFQQRPHTLQLNRQQPIYFNGDQDTIFIDCESMFNLYHYVFVWRNDRQVPQRSLVGFNLVKTLGHFNNVLPPAEIIDPATLPPA